MAFVHRSNDVTLIGSQNRPMTSYAGHSKATKILKDETQISPMTLAYAARQVAIESSQRKAWPQFMTEQEIEASLIGKLAELKYIYRADINSRAALESNFREKFDALNRVKLTDSEFSLLLNEIITPDVFTAAKILRNLNAFTRDDGTPLNYSLVNLKNWCKNDFEVINQLRINTEYSHHRYDVILLINGVPVMQI